MPTWLIWTLGLGVPLTAAAVPVIIHLINLTRYRRVDWAAMEFLLNAYRKTRRRMQLESLIMLLLRVLAVILLATALFPMGCQVVKDWAAEKVGLNRLSLSTDAPLHLVLVFDDSASMAYTQEGQSAFERGRNYALTLIESMRPGRDRMSIIRVSDVYVPPRAGGIKASEEEALKSTQRRVSQLASLDSDAARDAIAATSVAAVDTNMLGALREAGRAVETTADQDACALVVISDFVESGWKELRVDGSVHKDFRDVMDKMNERLKKSGTTATFFDAGFETTQNFAIRRVECKERIVGNGMEAEVEIEVAYYASGKQAEQRNPRLKYRIDGGNERPIGRPPKPLDPGKSDLVSLKLSANDLALRPDEQKTGASRNIEVFTDEPDALRNDNSRSLVIHVVPNIPILVVNGGAVDARNVALDETFYLDTALGVSTSKSDEDTGEKAVTRITPNRVVSITADKLSSIESFLDYRLVVLCAVPVLSDAMVARLEEFVAAGYGLLIFDGTMLQAGPWNDNMYKKGAGLLPVKLRDLGGSMDPNATLYGLSPEARSHPVMRPFSEPAENLAIITNSRSIRNWRTVEIPTGAEADPMRPVEVVLSLNLPAGPVPFLVDRPFGRGRVMYEATTAGQAWNTLWNEALPLFLYLEISQYLTGNEARYSNISVGEPWRRVLRAGDNAPRFTLRDPAGTQGDLLATADQGLKLLEYAGTAQTGVYTVTALDRTEGGETRKKWAERFTVSLDPRESNIVRLAGETEKEDAQVVLRKSLEGIDIQFLRAGSELGEGALAGADQGGGLWMWLAIFGAVFLLLETLWSAVITKPED